MEVIAPGLVVGEIASDFGTFHYRGVVFIGRQHIFRVFLEGIFNHFKQRLRLLLAVDNPVGVKNFVAAMFRVGLREHIQFNVVRIAAKLNECVLQVVDFVIGQRQPQTEVGVNQRLTSLAQQVHAGHRCRLMVSKQLLSLFQLSENALHHAIVQLRRNGVPLRIAQTLCFNVVRHAAFQPHDLR